MEITDNKQFLHIIEEIKKLSPYMTAGRLCQKIGIKQEKFSRMKHNETYKQKQYDAAVISLTRVLGELKREQESASTLSDVCDSLIKSNAALQKQVDYLAMKVNVDLRDVAIAAH